MARQKSAKVHSRVLEAALQLFGERGVDATSMDAVSEASGVSKATIYKHWTDKDALVLEALALTHGLFEEPPKFDSGDLRRDLLEALTYQPGGEYREVRNRMMPHLMAYAARHREFGRKWRSRVLDPPQERLRSLIRRGTARRQLIRGIDMTAAVALLLGPMLYWHIVLGRRSSAAVPESLAKQVVDAFWKAFAKRR